jgi:hypothetical protein
MLVTLDTAATDKYVQEKSAKEEYVNLDNWQKKYIMTCGTSLGLFYNKLDISVTKTLDKRLGYEGYGWANEPFVTCLQYCGTTTRHMRLRYIENMEGKKRIHRYVKTKDNWQLFLTPLIICYRRKHVFDLVERGIAEYWKVAGDCKTHPFFPEELHKYIGEVAIPPEYIPFPIMIIIGKSVVPHTVESQQRLNEVLKDLENRYSYIPIIHLPNISLTGYYSNGYVNAHRKSSVGLQVMQELKNKFSEYIEKF